MIRETAPNRAALKSALLRFRYRVGSLILGLDIGDGFVFGDGPTFSSETLAIGSPSAEMMLDPLIQKRLNKADT